MTVLYRQINHLLHSTLIAETPTTGKENDEMKTTTLNVVPIKVHISSNVRTVKYMLHSGIYIRQFIYCPI